MMQGRVRKSSFKLVHCFPICPQKSHASHLVQLNTHSKEMQRKFADETQSYKAQGLEGE